MTVNALGRAVFEPRTNGSIAYRISVTCLRTAGDRAVLGGPVSGARGGTRGVLFVVEDNGRGDRVDRISRLLLRTHPPKACPTPPPLGRSALQVRGHILVESG